MPQELKIVPAGLWTDPNPLSAVPEGAMTNASNVWIRRQGVVEPRPGFPSTQVTAAGATNERVVQLSPLEGDVLVCTVDSAIDGHVYTLDAGNEITRAGLFGTAAFEFTAGRIHTAAFGGNTYLTSDQGVHRITGSAATTAERAGLPRPPQALVGFATLGLQNYPLAADSAVAYRLVYRQRVNGRDFRGPPSARIVQRSYTGAAAKAVTLTLPFAAPYEVEIYRSAFATGYKTTPSDEMAMIGTIPVGGTTFTDDVPATHVRGPSLYTNGSQQGALLENGMPPLARDVASFRTMMFYAAAERPPALTWEVLGWGDDWRGSTLPYAQRVGGLVCNGTVTSGSNTITAIAAADIAKIFVGMSINDSAGTGGSFSNATPTWPAGVTVTAVGATSITVSANALANDTAFCAADWLQLSYTDSGGTTTSRVYVVGTSTVPTNYTDVIVGQEFPNSALFSVWGPQALAYYASQALAADNIVLSVHGDGVITPWTFVAESYNYDAVSLTVKCSRKDFTTARIDSSTGKTAERFGSKATLAWSKAGEPEHCPPGYTLEIGDAESAIWRVIPSRESLIVLKEDGAWRVSGYSPDALQLDELDRTVRLVVPDAACEWNGQVAAWTTRGVLLIGEGGTTNISDGKIQDALESTLTFVTPDTWGVGYSFMCAWLERECLFVRVGATLYCWCARTGAWTLWGFTRSMLSGVGANGLLYIGADTSPLVPSATYVMASDESLTDNASFPCTVYDVPNGTTIRIRTDNTAWVPHNGDSIEQGPFTELTAEPTFEVDGITSLYRLTVTDSTGFVAGAATGTSRTVVQTLRFAMQGAGNPGVAKVWRECQVFLGPASAPVAASISHDTDRASAGPSITIDPSKFQSDASIRTRINTASRRARRIQTTLSIRSSSPLWELYGIGYVFEPCDTKWPS